MYWINKNIAYTINMSHLTISLSPREKKIQKIFQIFPIKYKVFSLYCTIILFNLILQTVQKRNCKHKNCSTKGIICVYFFFLNSLYPINLPGTSLRISAQHLVSCIFTLGHNQYSQALAYRWKITQKNWLDWFEWIPHDRY